MNIDQYRALKAAQEAEAIQKENASEHPQTAGKEGEDNKTPQTNPPKEITSKENTSKETKETSEETKPKEEKIYIEGVGEVTIEELKKGYLRQADYTKKTQEISRKIKESEEAIALFNYLKSNPQITQQLLQTNNLPPSLDPNALKVQELENKLYDFMLEKEIETLQNKYEDFDVREVLGMANEKGIVNLEDAYLLLKSRKTLGKTDGVDIETLKKQLRQEILKELDEEKKSTSSIISSNDKSPLDNMKPKLTESEQKVARNFGMTDEEYIKWRDVGKKK